MEIGPLLRQNEVNVHLMVFLPEVALKDQAVIVALTQAAERLSGRALVVTVPRTKFVPVENHFVVPNAREPGACQTCLRIAQVSRTQGRNVAPFLPPTEIGVPPSEEGIPDLNVGTLVSLVEAHFRGRTISKKKAQEQRHIEL